MNANELVDRLIDDLKSSIAIRSSTPDIMTQVDNIGTGVNGNFIGALNTITFDNHLNIVSQLLNLPSNKPHEVLEYIDGGKDNLIKLVDNMLTNSDLVSLDDMQPVANILKDQLNELHRYSASNLI